ncbi:DNA polymerase I, partial [Methyloceanibacter sp.]|uniref:DNA polymerase I n=1 Tax=Methyloceanibacter sp. TaxID=1965321 RepID=UPI003D6CD6E1
IGDLAVHEPDHKRLIAFLKAMEFNSLTRRVAEFAGIDVAQIEADGRLGAAERGGTANARAQARPQTPAASTGALPLLGGGMSLPKRPTADASGAAASGMAPQNLISAVLETLHKIPFDRSRYAILRNLEQINGWVTRALDLGAVAIATEGQSLDSMRAALCGVSLALTPNEACYIPIAHRKAGDGGSEGLFAGGIAPDQISEQVALDALRPLLENGGIVKIGHDLKFAWQMFSQRGIELYPYDDTLLISYVLDAGRGGHGLDELVRRHFDHVMIDHDALVGSGKSRVPFDCVDVAKAAEYGAERADATFRLWRLLKPRLPANHVATVYETLERPLMAVLARMERRGISVDRQTLSRLSGEFAQRAAALEAEVRELAGDPSFNPGSPKQLGDILFGKMGLGGGAKTKTGQWATGARVLDELAEQGHELPQKILHWRQVTKLKSTYTDALPGYINPDTRRVHTSYALAATPTGRLSSSEPNLQNIPIRTEEGRKIRRAFIATEGHKLASADYSQIELRLLAEIAGIEPLRKAFRDGLDIHAMTASEMFGVPVNGMPAEVRRRAKAINFGIIYGISAFGLANQLGIAREEAGAYIRKYFERFPGIRDYMEETKAFCKKNGYVLTLFGRKCHYPDIAAANASIRSFNERAAINARLQGTAADIIRRAMVRMDDALAKHKLGARMLLQVHDELVFEVPDDEVDKTLPVIKQVMEDAPMPAISLSVPLQVDARAAGNWDEAH